MSARGWVATVAGVILATALVVVVVMLVVSAPPTTSIPEGTRTESPTVSAEPTFEPLSTPTPLPTTAVPADRAPVDVVLATWNVDAEGIVASAYVAGIVEEGGTCTLRARFEERDVAVQGTAVATGQNVSCGFLSIPAGSLVAGNWDVWFEYESPTYSGVSSAVEMPFGVVQ